MTIEEALYSKLASVAGITALVSTRIYPDAAPQGATRPLIVYRHSGRTDKACLSGDQSGLVLDDFELLAEGLEREDCAQIRDAISDGLDGTTARGTWGGVGGLAVRGCTITTASASQEQPPEASEDFRREALLDLTIIWKRG